MSPDNEVSTPVNVIGRERINVLIRNNMLNRSVEFQTDNEVCILNLYYCLPCPAQYGQLAKCGSCYIVCLSVFWVPI